MGFSERMRLKLVAATARAKDAGDRHVSIAVPFRAMERNRRSAASVLAGGVAYRLFSWLLPVALIVGGLLGLGDPDDIESAVATGGLPQAVVEAIGDIARAAETNSWWLLVAGVPMLLWEGHKGAKAMQLIHALVWDEPAPHSKPLTTSLAFSGTAFGFLGAMSLTWWLRDTAELEQLAVWILMIAPLAALWLVVSLHLPHGTASWTALLPGALLVAISFQVAHGLLNYFLTPSVETSMSLYGALAVTATLLFYMWVVGRIVVTAPLLNSSLHDELSGRARLDGCNAGVRPASVTFRSWSPRVKPLPLRDSPPVRFLLSH